MATPQLPSTNSVVDYLASTGKDTSFTSRRSMFNESGLGKRLGDYTGSANQNMALLESLRSKPSFYEGKAPPNAFENPKPATSFLESSPVLKPFSDALVSMPGSTTPKQKPMTPDPNAKNLQGFSLNPLLKDSPTQKAIIEASKPKTGFNLQEIVNNAVNSGGASVTTPTAPAGTTPAPAPAPSQTSQNAPGIDVGSIMKTGTSVSEAGLIDQYLNSTEGKLALEKQELGNLTAEAKAEALKQELETKYASEKTALEDKLASNGLAFSGIRGSQVKALADSLASSLIGADRDLASKLLDADIKFRETVLDGVAELIKEAQAENDDAIKQLNAAGWAVIGDQLVPTLARENATIDDIRADAQLAISQRRLALAEESNARAAAKFANGDTDKEAEFAILNALLDEAGDETTDNEIIAWATENTNLAANEITAVINKRPNASWAESQAIAQVQENYAKPGVSRALPGDQTAKALKAAKEKAKEAARDLKFNSSAERQLYLQFVDTVTPDELE